MKPVEQKAPLVLVGEDADEIALMVANTLEHHGLEVVHAEDGQRCLALAQSLLPNCIVLDLMMPKLHGLEVLKALKASDATRSIKVIVCTDTSHQTETDQARQIGADEFLAKPFTRQDLVDTIGRTLHSTTPSNGQNSPAPHRAYSPKNNTSRGIMKLWGTRGSIPVSGARYVRHGGNTTCLQFHSGEHQLIFDAGSGIRDLGLTLAAGKPCKIHLFITHTHWDHIQGFPFFQPAFIPGFDITIYGAPNLEKDLKSLFFGQMDRSYFPVQMEDMTAQLNFVHLEDQCLDLDDIRVSWEYTLHPSPTVGYKIDVGAKQIAFVPDNEFLMGYTGPPDAITPTSEVTKVHAKIIDFFTGVDILIHEAQYTCEEYHEKIGWGHTSISNGCALVNLTGVKKWIIPHHDPLHDDDFLQHKLSLTQQILAELGPSIKVQHAFDGMVIYP